MDAVNAALEQFYRGNLTQTETLNQIARISGANSIEHTEAKEA